MKTTTFTFYCIVFLLIHATRMNAQTNTFPSTGSAGIGTTAPDASSALEIKSATQGILVPRMTKNQRDAIVTPATGLMIFQTNSSPGFYYYDGTAWKAVTPKATAGWSLTGNTGTDTSVNFMGTTDNKPLIIKVNNKRSGYLDSASANTTWGFSALSANGQKGTSNSAFGALALASNTTGNENTATGNGAMQLSTFGSGNTANGYHASDDNAGNDNTAFGVFTLTGEHGNGNTAVGYEAGFQLNNPNDTNCTFIGNNARPVGTNISLVNATAIGANASVTSSNSLVLGSVAGSFLSAVNVGVGVTSPGASLHIRGRGNVVGHSSLLVENSSQSPGLYVGDNSLVGIGTSSPSTRLFIKDGSSSGGTPFGNSSVVIDKNGFSYLQMLTPDASESGLFFGVTSNNISGGFVFNNSTNKKGLQVRTGGSTKLRIDSTGRLAVGNFAPSHRLQLDIDDAAKPGTGTWTIASDKRLKKNIVPFTDGLKLVKKINPVWFEYNGLADLQTGKKFVGVVAQDMQKVAPYMVGSFMHTDTATGKGSEYLDYNPNSLFYILVNAVKELSADNDVKNEKIDSLQKYNDNLEQRVAKLEAMMGVTQPVSSANIILNNGTALGQNVPNPFNHSTTIGYTLPQKFNSAQIMITDKNGKTLKAVTVSGAGKGKLNIDASTLAAGAYNYSLIVDGRLIDTKQMVLTK
jgi:trimeric autotransporter adhesin